MLRYLKYDMIHCEGQHCSQLCDGTGFWCNCTIQSTVKTFSWLIFYCLCLQNTQGHQFCPKPFYQIYIILAFSRLTCHDFCLRLFYKMLDYILRRCQLIISVMISYEIKSGIIGKMETLALGEPVHSIRSEFISNLCFTIYTVESIICHGSEFIPVFVSSSARNTYCPAV